jgi:hypothetical protein
MDECGALVEFYLEGKAEIIIINVSQQHKHPLRLLFVVVLSHFLVILITF